MATTYIKGTCQVGQREACGKPAVYALGVVTVADTAWATETRDGGVVLMCDYHSATPVSMWES